MSDEDNELVSHPYGDRFERHLRMMIGLGMKRKKIAKHLGISDNILKHRMRRIGVGIRSKYSNINDRVLNGLICELYNENDRLGVKMIRARLCEMGLHIQRIRIVKGLNSIECYVARKGTRKIKRRSYYVRAPLSMVHIDGFHKLVRWRIVLHGGIDGFSRMIYFLGVSDNNRASTVLKLFLTGAKMYGLPSRVRSDKGRENVGVAEFMIATRGLNRGSMITGRSVHNVRIERFWRDLRRCCIEKFREMFYSLEDRRILDHKDEVDLFCLHYCFKHVIIEAVEVFTSSWNMHGLRTEGNETPEILFWTGLADLQEKAEKNNHFYSELYQPPVDWEAVAFEGLDDPENSPSIVLPPMLQLSGRQKKRLRTKFPKRMINRENACEMYVKELSHERCNRLYINKPLTIGILEIQNRSYCTPIFTVSRNQRNHSEKLFILDSSSEST